MEKIRKGNDIEILWAIYAGEGVNEAPYNLEGKNLSLYLVHNFERREVFNFSVEGHILKWRYLGKEQRAAGKYTLELVENEGREGMHTIDECDAFQLVNRSCEADNNPEGRVECIHLQFRSSMTVGFPAIGAGVVVDSELSLVSENPVQNKVLTAAMYEEIARAKAEESKLQKQIDEFSSKLTHVNLSVEIVENSLVNVNARIDLLEDRLSKVETGEGSAILTKVEEIELTLQTLNADSSVEGSVDNRINRAVEWAALSI